MQDHVPNYSVRVTEVGWLYYRLMLHDRTWPLDVRGCIGTRARAERVARRWVQDRQHQEATATVVRL